VAGAAVEEAEVNGALTIDAVVRNGDVHVTEDFYTAKRTKAAKRWGDGTALKIRIEPEEEAWRFADIKHYYGHLVKPVSADTGETLDEVHTRWKALFFPDDGRTSLTQLNRDELTAYMESCEQHMREETPKAWDKSVSLIARYQERRDRERQSRTTRT
jgi:hypothetical protein